MIRRREVQWNLLEKAHALVADVIEPGDTVVDATMGNGHDTLFLARCVGNNGRVFGFDIQGSAVASTDLRLREAGISPSCFSLHRQSHAEMHRHLESGVSAVLFNLGYLPGSDKSLVTQTRSTLEGLSQAWAMLGDGGILSIMCYPGHLGGADEAKEVSNWVKQQLSNASEISLYCRITATEKTPFLWCVCK